MSTTTKAWVRFQQEGQICWGTLEGNTIHVCAGSPLDPEHHCGAHCGVERLPLDSTPLLAPCTPTKIIGVGRNYRAHARELGNEVPATPLFFLKPPSALLAPGGVIRLPAASRQVEHEGELGVVMRRRLRALAPGADPRPFMLGFTCVNDVTARDLQRSDTQWTRAKGFDTFCPVGPCVVEPDAAAPLAELGHGFEISLEVNGERRQHGHTRDCIFSIADLLVAISAVMTLEPGDVLATGTPAGVGPLVAGDRVQVAIPGIGVLENGVVAA